ncbi:MAG: MBL fold metallo-hydrolase [Pseudomonadales bacterium]|jgi:ribonuclease BN (tRNA processing enzyme)|nr:MBL fold metallo-hydrolase [Pseudomonadales bacterium]
MVRSPRLLALLALAGLPATALAAPDFGTLGDFDRTVTEQPFEVVVDRRACGDTGVYVQVLGSGGEELDDGSASSGYVVWVDGEARVLVDTGPGSAAHFEEAGGRLEDLDAILLSQLKADHSADLAALLAGSRSARRSEPLPLYGPDGGSLTPGFNEWIDLMFGPRGAYRYLADLFSPLSSTGFEVVPYELETSGRKRISVLRRDGLVISAIPTDHGPYPSLAWRVDVDGVGITFTGDTGNRRQTVAELAAGSTLLIAHHGAPENVRGAARELYMPPSQIGKLAADADVNMVILSHRSSRTRGRENQSRREITERFKGVVVFANDLECWET